MIAEIAAALGLFKSAKDDLTVLTAWANSAKNYEINTTVLKLSGTLSELQIQIMNAKEKMMEIEAENERLKAAQNVDQGPEMVFVERENCYKQRDGDGKLTGKLCPKCFDALGKAVNMLNRGSERFACPNCNTVTKGLAVRIVTRG